MTGRKRTNQIGQSRLPTGASRKNQHQHSFWCALVVFGLVGLWGATVYATNTQPIGEVSGTHFTQSCYDNRALTGIDVWYGPNAVGRVRGICHKMNTAGQWVAGDEWKTPWSPVSSQNETQNTTNLHCPTDHVVSAFEGKVSGSTINALRIQCRKITGNGNAALDLSSDAVLFSFAGANAGYASGLIECGTKPGRSLNGWSKGHLTYFYLNCEPPALQQSQVVEDEEIYTFEGTSRVSGVLNFAKNQGFQFPEESISNGLPPSTCNRHAISQMEVMKVMLPPAPVTTVTGHCEFKFLQQRMINAGWYLTSVRVATDKPEAAWEWGDPLPQGQRTPHSVGFSIKARAKSPGTAVHISRITLKGPRNTDWREAFKQ